MEIQIALAGNSTDTEKFKAQLVAQGFEIRPSNTVVRQGDDWVDGPPDPNSDDLTAYKTFKDASGTVRAELQMSLDAGENVEYNGRVRINIGEPNQKTAYWFSVHSENVDGKLEVYDQLLTQLYGPANR